ncbi:MAG TPA: carboxypeptidase-like regulatory domain-containing protein [Candidatus Polarisedimenticolia bacterium]|nr:carboxypeptidase-like regulatory domain-containing protein [Candidatus Polarisedimenticolia bacterium]
MRAMMFPACVILAAAPALAGEMYGTVTEAGRPVEGASVEARCGAKAYPAARTDKGGSYHLAVQEKGKCTLTVQHKGQSPSLEVASYDEGVQIDLVLELKGGAYTVRRK